MQPTLEGKSTTIVLRDTKSAQDIWEFEYDAVAERIVATLEAGWSPDSKHVGITIQSGVGSEVMVLRVEDSEVEEVEILPIPPALDREPRHSRGGEVFGHWENTRSFWTSENRKDRFFRYSITPKGKLLADKYEDHAID